MFTRKYIDKNSWWEFPPASHVASFLGTLEASISKLPCFTLAKIHPNSWKNPSQTNVASVPYHLFFCVVCMFPFRANQKKQTLPKHFTLSRHDGCIFSSPVSQEIRRSLPSTNLSRAPWFESVEPFPSSRHLNRTAFPSWTWSRLQIVSLSCLKIAGVVASWKSRETTG